MEIVAIIQARMTSTRLPGKVLMEIMGRPLLSYQVERLRLSRGIGRIIMATTTNREDDPVAELAGREGISVFRGSEHDVLDRYYQAAREFGCGHVMRITGDNPLVEPEVCDRLVEIHLGEGADYSHTGPRLAEGLDCELFTRASLEKAWREAKLPSEREHVTLYINHHPELFKISVMDNDTDDSKYRITVDDRDDFEVVETIFTSLYPTAEPYIRIKDIKSFLRSNPEVMKKNMDKIRNEGLLISLENDVGSD